MTVRVMIVDDSSFVRRAVRRMLATDPDLAVVGEAGDGRTAVREIVRLAPDVVTLDLRMPGLEGLATLEALRTERPTPVVLLSSYAQADAALTLQALAAGAVDFVDKSRVSAMDVYALAPELAEKLKAAAASRANIATAEAPRWLAAPSSVRPQLIVLGASTGGPAALEAVLAGIPAELGAAVLVVQHMPRAFTTALVRRFAAICRLPVNAAQDGELLAPGEVAVAPGGHDLEIVAARGGWRHRTLSAEGRARPRLDVALASVAETVGAAACAVVLTGMGDDGVAGARALRRAGGTVVAEAASTCVVHGMPRAVADAGLATCIAPLGAIAGVLASLPAREVA
jgi:two-component system chemotaxis response regulator CheB